jgi:hypothetical protein
MSYTIDQLNEYMDRLQAEEKEIRIDRGKRYGSPDDTLANVREFGADGCIISMWECFMRCRNSDIHPIVKVMLQVLVEDIRAGFGKPKNLEDMKNYVMDARNFMAYALKFVEDESAPLHVCACEHNTPEVVPWVSPTIKEAIKAIEQGD